MDHHRDLTRVPSAPRRSPTLVGRAAEQIFLREELAAAIAGNGRLVVIGGEAGIGKTTLAQDLVREASAQDQLTLMGQCFDLSHTPPYGPWLDLFAGYPGDSALPAPPSAFARGMLDRIADQAALFAEVRQFFACLAAARPLLLLLEDLHWADPASIELLRHVSRHARHWPLLIVGTYRIDEPSRGNAFYRLLPTLVREAAAYRLDLRQLDRAALSALISDRYALPDADLRRLTDYLQHHADGNPFFATELLRSVEEHLLIAHSGNTWVLGELDRVVVPRFLRQVIAGRVDRLDEAVREPLAIAAVIGQEVSLALWAEVARLDDESLLAVVGQAADAHVLATGPTCDQVQFVHALTREALYENILPPRRRFWHGQAAEALLAGLHPDPDAVAYHLQHANDPRAWEWLVKAADRAQRGLAWQTAVERLRAATDLLAGIDDEAQRRARLLHRLGRLRRFANPADAIGVLNEAGRLAAILGDRLLAAEILYIRGVALSYLDSFRDGLAAMSAAADTLEAMPLELTSSVSPTDPWVADALPEIAPLDLSGEDEAARLLHEAGLHFRRSTQPWFLASLGCCQQAISLGERYIAALADAPGAVGGVRSTACFAYHGLGIAHAAMGQPNEASQAWQRAREIASEYGHYPLVTFALLAELRDSALTFRAAAPDERRQRAQDAEAALARAGGAFCPGLSPQLAHLGCLLLDGKWSEAHAILAELPEPANAFLRREVTAATATLARHRGEPDLAWTRIHARFPSGPATPPGDHIHQEGLFLQRLAADLALDTGDLTAAHAWLTAHDQWLAWSGCMLGRADGQLQWARYHLAAGNPKCARRLADEALALASEPAQPLSRLAAHRLLGEIDIPRRHHGDAESHLLAALDLADRCQAPFERALTLLAMAELRASEGAVADAIAELERARLILIPLEALPALAKVNALAERLAEPLPPAAPSHGLTPREIDVLHMLALRQTDREIAEALFLGPRTIQSHVAHILIKLEASNRREAAQKAERLGLL